MQAGTLPAGRYATFLHVGPYRHDEVDDLSDARRGWPHGPSARDQPRELGDGPRHAFRASLERYLTDASREPDWSKWETELSHLIESD